MPQQMVLPQTPAELGLERSAGKASAGKASKTEDSRFDSVSQAERKRMDRRQSEAAEQSERPPEAPAREDADPPRETTTDGGGPSRRAPPRTGRPPLRMPRPTRPRSTSPSRSRNCRRPCRPVPVRMAPNCRRRASSPVSACWRGPRRRGRARRPPVPRGSFWTLSWGPWQATTVPGPRTEPARPGRAFASRATWT